MPIAPASERVGPGRSILFVLHQMGTLDHALSLYRQITREGGTALFALGDNSLRLPEWFKSEVPGLALVEDPLQDIREGRFDAVVMQMPYDELKAPVWSTIGREDAFIVYSGYGVQTTNWIRGAYELPFYKRCSLILASSPFAREHYLRSEFAPNSAIWSGDPLMFELNYAEIPAATSPVIMWAPHWSEKWVNGEPGFSTWKTSVRDVLFVARRRVDTTFIVRGHPLMQTHGQDAESKKASKLYNTLLSLPNVRLSTVSMKQDILDSTSLLTDGISIIAYYAATGKPMAVSRKGSTWPPFNAAGKALVSQCDIVDTSKSIRKWLFSACDTDLPPPSSERMDLVAHLFPVRDASPGKLMLDSLDRVSPVA